MLGKDEIARGDGKLNTIIGKGSTFIGNLEVAGGLRIDGKVQGDVKAESVFMGKEAEVVGNISTHSAILGGKITGNVNSAFIELQAKAELYGDVETKTLIVAEGVILQGNCDMGKGSEKPKSTSAPAPAKEKADEKVDAPDELAAETPPPEANPEGTTPEDHSMPFKKDKHKKR
jgi:cytoskeletal protein CcmA (bactofilin family)